MTRIIRLFAAAALALALPLAARPCAAEEPGETTVVVAAAPEAAPFVLVRDGPPRGFALDLLQEALADSRFRVQAMPVPFKTALAALETGMADILPTSRPAAASSVSGTSLVFSRLPFAATRLVILAPYDAPLGDPGTLADARLAVTRNSEAARLLAERGHAVLLLAESEAAALGLLLQGQADAFCGDEATARAALPQDIRGRLRLLGEPLRSEALYFAVNPRQEGLAEALDQGMERAMSDGAYLRLYSKWFGPPLDGDPASLLPGGGETVGQGR